MTPHKTPRRRGRKRRLPRLSEKSELPLPGEIVRAMIRLRAEFLKTAKESPMAVVISREAASHLKLRSEDLPLKVVGIDVRVEEEA